MKRTASLGFTLPELIIVMTIMLSLIGYIGIALINSQRNASLKNAVSVLVSDWKSQQMNALVGYTGGRSSADSYGIYFSSSSYTLFHGLGYSPSDTSNLTIPLDTQFQFSPAGKTVVFLRQSGNIATFSATQNSVTLTDTTDNQTKTILFNQYGVIIAIN